MRDFRAFIDSAYGLRDIVDTYRFVESGQKQGIIVSNRSAD